MTTNDRLEQQLTAWFFDTAMPMRIDDADDILRRTAGTRQRPRWTFFERWIPMRATTLGRPLMRSLPWRTIGLLATLLLLIAALWAFSVGNRPRVPEPFGDATNGLVAFSRGGDIVTVDPVTQVEETLVAGPESDTFPLFSPDGTKIVFERSGAMLFLVDSTGGTPRSLLAQPDDGFFGLQWTPDGSALVYSNGDLVVVNADGSGSHRLDLGTARSKGFPMLRPPRGDEILFMGSIGGAGGLMLVGRDGSDLRNVTTADGKMITDGLGQWTPDGAHILTQRPEAASSAEGVLRFHLLTVDPVGRVTEDRAVGPAMVAGPFGYTLSRDGTKAIGAIAQASVDPGWRIGVVPLDGVGPVVETGPVFTATEVGVAWSPDSHSIIVNDSNANQVWVLDAFGGPGSVATWNDPNLDAPTWQRRAP